MNYKFIYLQEVNRVIPAVLIDARASIPEIANQVGAVIKAYTDSKVALVTDAVIPYRIETEEGNLAGYFVLQVLPKVEMQQFVVRPAFKQVLPIISAQINTFIQQNQWKADFLF